MTIEIAPTAAARFNGLIIDNAPSVIAMIPRATDNTIKVFLTFSASPANLVRTINTAKTTSRSVIAPRARARPSGLTWLKTTITPARITRAPDIARSIKPAFAAY